MTRDPSSTLGQASDAHLLVSVTEEACPLNLAPTSSTTAALVMGDALAIALLEARGFHMRILPSVIQAEPRTEASFEG